MLTLCKEKTSTRARFQSLLKKVKSAANKAIWPDIGKLAILKGLEHLLRLYAKGASKIKNKKIKLLLNSSEAHSLANMGTKRYLLKFCNHVNFIL